VKFRTLASEEWIPRRERHRQKVSALLDAYLRHRARGQSDPVVDFLFTYYNLTPGQLRRWHPGFGVTLTGCESREYAALRGYCRTDIGVHVAETHLLRRRDTVEYVMQLMEATASRPANLGCFGLHEWAMVYGTGAGDLRHDVPLRLGHDGTDTVVESMPLRCTHFDAFRFFTDPARPRNAAQLTRSGQVSTEQPGCLHAGMDIYKFTAKLLPLVNSELAMDAFELAYAARKLDMRASPYDLSAYGYAPVQIETPTGRAEYVRQQAALSQRAASVRTALVAGCRVLLAASAANERVYAHAEDDSGERANAK
jgi:hypothetical protein